MATNSHAFLQPVFLLFCCGTKVPTRKTKAELQQLQQKTTQNPGIEPAVSGKLDQLLAHLDKQQATEPSYTQPVQGGFANCQRSLQLPSPAISNPAAASSVALPLQNGSTQALPLQNGSCAENDQSEQAQQGHGLFFHM